MPTYPKSPNNNLSGRYPDGWSKNSQNAGSTRVTIQPRRPSANDFRNCFIGMRWIYRDSTSSVRESWTLVDKDKTSGTWIICGAGSATLQFTTDDGHIAIPIANNIYTYGGHNINTTSASNKITINLNKSIHLPNSNATGSEGVIYLGATGTPLSGGTAFLHNIGTNNTFIGSNSGNFINDGTASQSVGIGTNALSSLVTNSPGCVAIGYNALYSADNTDIGHVAIGAYAGESLTGPMAQPNGCIAIGYKALRNCTATAYASQAIGSGALSNCDSGSQNVAIGSGTLGALTDSYQNVGIANGVLNRITTGSHENTVIGHGSAHVLEANKNVFVGNEIIPDVTHSGSVTGNIIIGSETVQNLLGDFDYNIIIGHNSGNAYVNLSESSNIIINNEGVADDDHTIRLGTHDDTAPYADGTQNRCFIAGIYDITTAHAGSTVPVLIDQNSQLGTAPSSIRYKENVHNLGDESKRLYDLRPITFNYKVDTLKTKQYGLIAEEVAEILPQLVVYNKETDEPQTVKYHDLPVLLLNELQEQNAIISNLKDRVRILEEQVSLLLVKMSKD